MMQMGNYIIDYICKDKQGAIIAQGKIRAKNKGSKFEAQCSFEEHLKKKHTNFGSLVIKSCALETILGPIDFEELFNTFKK